MSIEQQEYVFAPWGDDECDTADLVIELPSRELVVQLEVPTNVLDSMAQLGDRHGISVERALAERLELNRARTSLLAAKSVDDVAEVRDHLTAACEFLSGVEALDTDDIEAEIETLWNSELDSD
jgi:hypothetical protein